LFNPPNCEKSTLSYDGKQRVGWNTIKDPDAAKLPPKGDENIRLSGLSKKEPALTKLKKTFEEAGIS
ncbi:MAG: hypothetical protein QXD51_04345, partial [Candidatus Anstonellales archaeon]